MNTENDNADLHVINRDELDTEAEIVEAETAGAADDPELDAQTDQVVEALLALNPEDHDARQTGKNTAAELGLSVQEQSAKKLDMLKAPIHRIVERGDTKGDVGSSLADLKVEVERADPRRFDFDPGWFSRMIGYLPFIGTPLKRYFVRYESTRSVIDAIVKSLGLGREQLKRDNEILADDQKTMRELTGRLAKAVSMGQMIDRKLEERLAGMAEDDGRQSFLSEEVLFPLRQRIIDLQQQLAVNQQGILATELISRNNSELIRGVNRAINVTSRALQVAATVAIALADQKAVLDKVESVNKTTSDMIAGTAEQLKEQGAAIQKQASSAMLDMESLKSAFADIDVAITDLQTFRSEALPMMAQTIQELDVVTDKASESIQRLDAIPNPENRIKLDV